MKNLNSVELLNTIDYIQKLAEQMTIDISKDHLKTFKHAGDNDSHFNKDEFLKELRKILKATLPTRGDGDKENNRISDRFIERFQKRYCKHKCWEHQDSVRNKITFCKFYTTANNSSSLICTLRWIYRTLLEIQNEEANDKFNNGSKPSNYKIYALYNSLEKKRFEEALEYFEKYITIMEKVNNG